VFGYWSILLAFCFGVSSPSVAAPVLDFGPVEITVSASFFHTSPVLDSDIGVVEPNDPTVFSALVQPNLFFRFPTSPSTLPAGFVSSQFTAERKGGVGASGFVFDGQTSATAQATYLQAILNLGDEDSGPLAIDYVIPGLEASIFPGSAFGSEVQAFAAARLIATIFDVAGTELSRDRVFSYELGQSPPPLAGDGIFRSADLRDEQGDGFLISTAGVRGIEYGPFDGSRSLPIIPAGGRLELLYEFEAGGSAISREHGFQAFVGDPFNISGGFNVRPTPSAAVPEPATFLLVPGALACLLFIRRR
jgi:hypothetical protein